MFNSTQGYRFGKADYEKDRKEAATVNKPVPKPNLPLTKLKTKPFNAPVHPPVPIEAKPPSSVVHPPPPTVQGVQQGHHQQESKRLCSIVYHRISHPFPKAFRMRFGEHPEVSLDCFCIIPP